MSPFPTTFLFSRIFPTLTPIVDVPFWHQWPVVCLVVKCAGVFFLLCVVLIAISGQPNLKKKLFPTVTLFSTGAAWRLWCAKDVEWLHLSTF